MIKNNTISITDIISQKEGNIVSDMDGEKVMLSIDNGKYYNLGTVGSEIWELIEKPISVSVLLSTLMDRFEVTKTECETQVISFLSDLLKNDLIQCDQD